MNDSRTNLRRALIERRDSLGRGELDSAAQAVSSRILDVVPSNPGVVAGYLAYGGELDVMPAVHQMVEHGWSLVLPVCGPKASMEFCPWSPGEELARNRLGIDEPQTAPVDLETIDLVLVPGVGFDVGGSRIGHGMGFYDRYFARCAAIGHDPVRIGVAHDIQVVELPVPESWDVPMHSILTPTKVIDTTSCA